MSKLFSYLPARWLAAVVVLLAAAGPAWAQLTTLDEHFDAAPPSTWNVQNLSSPVGSATWFQGATNVFGPQATSGYVAANFQSTGSTGTISNWLLTPQVVLANGATFSFWTRTEQGGVQYADRLQVRLSTAGTSTNVGASATAVGDFTQVLLDINPTYSTTAYPKVWTKYAVTLTGLSATTTGRLAFRYFVENAGSGSNRSDYIGVDEVTYQAVLTATAAPVLTTPANNATTKSLPTFAGTAPAGSSVTVYVNNSSVGTTTATGGSFSLTPTTALASGSYSAYATAQSSGQAVSANSNANTFTVDATPPTITSFTSTAGPSGSSTTLTPLPFSVTFSEAVTGFSASGISVANGSVTSGPTGSGSGPYTFSVQASTPAPSPTLVSIRDNAAQDAAGNGNFSSSSYLFYYEAPPTLTAASPASGPVGTQVLLSGTYLSGATAVRFNGTPATFTFNGLTLTATVPSGATSGPVTVTTRGGTGGGVAFAVTPLTVTTAAPTNIATMSATLGGSFTGGLNVGRTEVGVVYVAGNNTPTLSNQTILSQGYFPAPATASFSGSAIPLSPGTTYSARAYVTDNSGTTYGNVVTFTTSYYTPTLARLSPASGPAGTSVTLTGQYLDGTTAVRFNNTAASFTANADGTLTATVPAGATSGPVTVTTPGGTSNGVAFTVLTAAPTLTTPYGNLPNNGTAPFSGTAPAGSTVTLYLTPGGGTTQVLATVPAAANGTFSYTPATALASGSYSAYATAQGSNQGVSAPGNTISFTLDSTPPTVLSFTRLSPTTTLTNAAAVTLRLVFSEDVMRVPNGLNVTVTGSLGYPGVSVTPFGSSSVYEVTLSNLSGSGTLTLSLTSLIADAAGNALASTGPLSQFYTIDRIAPTATVSTTAGSTTSTAPIPFAVTFSEPVTGFGAAGIDVRNGTITGSTVSGSGSGPYTFGVTPTSSGSVTVSVNGSAQDAAGNRSLPSNVVSVTYTPITATTWTGTLSPDWFTAGNWSAGVPTATMDAAIPAGTPFSPSIASGTATSRALTLGSGATLNMSGGTLDAQGQWTNNGTFAATGGTVQLGGQTGSLMGSSTTTFWNLTTAGNAVNLNASAGLAVRRLLTTNTNLNTNGYPLTLLSDASGTALAVNPTAGTGVIGSSAQVQRYIGPATYAGAGYRHLSSPTISLRNTEGTMFSDLATANFTPVVNPAYNTVAAPGNTQPFPNIFGYDQSRLATASNNLSAFDKGYYSPSSTSERMTSGLGYTVNLAANQAVTFKGQLGFGELVVNLSRNPAGTANAASAGWQLLGNPYPSPYNYGLQTAGDRPGLDAAIYVYTAMGPYVGQYRAILGTIGDPILPMGQAFFARVSATQTSGTLIFHNANRVTSYQNPTYQRPTETRPLVQLTLAGPASALADAVYVYFDNGATDGYEPTYDALKLPNTTGLNLSTSVASQQLAIDGRAPLGSLQRVVPLAVGVPAVGSYTLTAAQLLNLPGVLVYLRDLLSGAVVDLAQQPSYSFTVSNASALVQGRFELVLSPQQALATAPAALAEQVGLYPNPARSQAALTLPAALGSHAATATLVDALGRAVRTVQLPTQGAAPHQLDLHGLASGVYALRLSSSAGVLVKKLTIE